MLFYTLIPQTSIMLRLQSPNLLSFVAYCLLLAELVIASGLHTRGASFTWSDVRQLNSILGLCSNNTAHSYLHQLVLPGHPVSAASSALN